MEVFKNLDEIMRHFEIVPFIGGNVKTKVNKAIAIVKNHIDNNVLVKNFKPEDIEHMKSSAQLMVSLIMERDIKKNIEFNFLRNFVYMVYNWNQNFEIDDTIEKNCVFVTNYLDKSLSLTETIQTLKTMTARLELYTKSDLPAFKLSDHYFKIIKEESENEFFMAPSPKGR